ncbi:hypothetical protein J1614_012112 [Plenodomus biglobosus]|nr:hypothetical protein J1614_012112 [Plenodomus biglobosus]
MDACGFHAWAPVSTAAALGLGQQLQEQRCLFASCGLQTVEGSGKPFEFACQRAQNVPDRGRAVYRPNRLKVLELAGCHACAVEREALLVIGSELRTLQVSFLHAPFYHGNIPTPLIGAAPQGELPAVS